MYKDVIEQGRSHHFRSEGDRHIYIYIYKLLTDSV